MQKWDEGRRNRIPVTQTAVNQGISKVVVDNSNEPSYRFFYNTGNNFTISFMHEGRDQVLVAQL